MKKNINGEYFFELKKFPQIKFKSIKNFGSEINDFEAQFHKYLFEKWNSEYKKEFKIEERITENGLLEYNTYIEIKTYDELIKAIEMIIEFLKYEENWNKDNGNVINVKWKKENQFTMPSGKMYLVNNDKRIYPYTSWFQTEEEIRENAQKTYINITNEVK